MNTLGCGQKLTQSKVDMSNNDYTETISIRLTTAQLKILKHCAAGHLVSVSDLIRRWIEESDVTPVLPQRLIDHLRAEAMAITQGTIGGNKTIPRDLIEYRLQQVFGRYWETD